MKSVKQIGGGILTEQFFILNQPTATSATGKKQEQYKQQFDQQFTQWFRDQIYLEQQHQQEEAREQQRQLPVKGAGKGQSGQQKDYSNVVFASNRIQDKLMQKLQQ